MEAERRTRGEPRSAQPQGDPTLLAKCKAGVIALLPWLVTPGRFTKKELDVALVLKDAAPYIVNVVSILGKAACEDLVADYVKHAEDGVYETVDAKLVLSALAPESCPQELRSAQSRSHRDASPSPAVVVTVPAAKAAARPPLKRAHVAIEAVLSPDRTWESERARLSLGKQHGCARVCDCACARM